MGDIDLLVEVKPGVGLLGLARCRQELTSLRGLEVDLVPADALKVGVTDSVLADARPL